MALSSSSCASLCASLYTTTLVVLATLSLVQISMQAALPSNYDIYNRDLAKTMMRYSVATYRPQSSLNAWNCDVCEDLTSFNLQAIISENTYRGRVIIGYDSSLHAIVVAFRGTDTIDNWSANLQAWPKKASLFGSDSGIKIHYGFYNMYLNLRTDLINELESMMADDQYAGAHLFVTGHSLGGAVSTIGALDFRTLYPSQKLTMYNFGSPRVGNKKFVKAYEKKVTASFRVVNRHDPVTELPFSWMNYQHVDEEVIVSDSNDHLTYLGISSSG